MRVAQNTLGRIPALDGIRGLAISLVLSWHVTFGGRLPSHPYLEKMLEAARFAWSGVDLFFVLSGFLIGGILLDAAKSPSYFSTFYIRRAYRIIPLYATLLMITLIVDLHYRAARPEWLGPQTAFLYYLFFLQNFLVAATGSFGPLLLAVTWSLAVEEQFYLTLPVAVRYIPRRFLWKVLVGAVVAAPLLRIFAMHFLKDKWAVSYVLMPCRADALCLGVLIAMASRSVSVWGKIAAQRTYLYAALALAGCAVIWMLDGSLQPFTEKALGLEYSLFAVFYSLLLLSALVSSRLSRLFCFAPVRFMGVVAYGVYLLHQPLIVVFHHTLLYIYPASRGVAGLLVSMFAVAVSLGLAAISWYYFEKPLVKRGHRHQYWTTGKSAILTAA